MKEIKYIILYLVPVNYGSGSDFLTSYGSGSASQKVTVPVPQHCLQVLVVVRYLRLRVCLTHFSRQTVSLRS
jgi:hypothetical protein